MLGRETQVVAGNSLSTEVTRGMSGRGETRNQEISLQRRHSQITGAAHRVYAASFTR